MKFSVLVREDYRWSVATVAGRPFSKHGATDLTTDDMTDEIRNSPILAVTEVEDAPQIDATDAARQMAEENAIDLAAVTGSGENGRIVVKDVELAIKARDGGGDDPNGAD